MLPLSLWAGSTSGSTLFGSSWLVRLVAVTLLAGVNPASPAQLLDFCRVSEKARLLSVAKVSGEDRSENDRLLNGIEKGDFTY